MDAEIPDDREALRRSQFNENLALASYCLTVIGYWHEKPQILTYHYTD